MIELPDSNGSEDLNAPSCDAAALLALESHSVVESRFEHGVWILNITPRMTLWSCEMLRAHRGYVVVSDITAVDRYPAEPRFEIVYHLLCHARKERLQLKSLVFSDAPELESVSGVWGAAAAYEREIFDFFGIRFRGQQRLRRDRTLRRREGYPLRKDYRTSAR